MLALIQLICLILATTLVKISESQSFGRNGHCNCAGGGNGACGGGSISRAYIPVVLTDQFHQHLDISSRTTGCPGPTTTGPCPATVPGQSSLSDNDLNALLQLARVLEADKTACATKGIDVDKLLETLVKALVYTTTHTVETSMNRCNNPAQNDANGLLDLLGQNGLLDKLLSAILGLKRDSGVISGVGGTLGGESPHTVNKGCVTGNDGLLGGVLNGVGGVLDGAGGTLNGVGGLVSGVGGTLDGGSPHTVNKGLLGSVTGNDGLVSGVLNGVGGTLNGVGGVLDGVGGTLNGVGGVLDGVGGTLNGVGGLLNGVDGTLDDGSINKTSKIAVDKKILGSGLLGGEPDGSGVVGGVGGIIEVYFK